MFGKFTCSICGQTFSKSSMNDPEPLLQEKGTAVCDECNKFVQLARIYSGWCPPAGDIPQQIEKFKELKTDEERLNLIKNRYNVESAADITEDKIVNIIAEQRDYSDFIKKFC